MSLINKFFKKTKKTTESGKKKIAEIAVRAEKKPTSAVKTAEFKSGDVLLSPLTTEKAVSGQSLNKYVFKVAPKANKIDIIKAVSKNYNVKVTSANIVNIPRKARQVGKTKGFKSGYKKAVVTLAKGQSIEIK